MIIINTDPSTLESSNSNDIISNDLELINKFSRRKLSKDEVYTFSIILCDNEVDRDFERFTISALNTLSQLFLGKTGIFDHSPKGSNQTARIFFTQVISDNSKLTSASETYTYILAKAYMVKSEKNRDLILDIDAGIKKEVSVGCCVSSILCSICSSNLKLSSCSHVIGQSYDGILCHSILDNPTDAYEWSFVAIPSQINAGIIKSHKKLNESSKDIIKSIKSSYNQSLSLSPFQVNQLKSFIEETEVMAEYGRIYRDDLKSEVTKLSFLSGNNISSDIFKSIADRLSITELKQFKKLYSSDSSPHGYQVQLPIEDDNFNRGSTSQLYQFDI